MLQALGKFAIFITGIFINPKKCLNLKVQASLTCIPCHLKGFKKKTRFQFLFFHTYAFTIVFVVFTNARKTLERKRQVESICFSYFYDILKTHKFYFVLVRLRINRLRPNHIYKSPLSTSPCAMLFEDLRFRLRCFLGAFAWTDRRKLSAPGLL